MRKKKVKRLIEKQGVKKGRSLSSKSSGRSGLTSFDTLLQNQRTLAASSNLAQAYGKWSHIATTFSALPITHRVNTIKKPPNSKFRESVLLDSSCVVQPKRCCSLNDDDDDDDGQSKTKNENIRDRQYLTTKIALNCSKTPQGRLFIVSLLYLLIVGHQITVISSKSFSRERGENFSQEYFVNSLVDHQSGFAANSAALKPARLDLLDQTTTTTTSDGILIQTKQGIFRGKLIENAVRSESRYNDDRIGGDAKNNNKRHKVIGFLGIRYASAPVRRLRFMPPTAFYYAPNQIHNAQEFGPICKQRWPIELVGVESGPSQVVESEIASNSSSNLNSNSNSSFNLELQLRLIRRMMAGDTFTLFKPLIKQLARREQSEDCLNLNIYLPYKDASTTNGSSEQQQQQQQTTKNNSQLPVLVIIHGESFDFGSGSSIKAAEFVRTNKRILVVTFNYRLNILGFPPQLSGASRGNLGLMDQVAALHWIKDNIGAFGGSPGNVTLLGTKRGAIFVNLLMLSPLAKGLFQRAIMEDGSALTPLVANNLQSGQNVHSNLQPIAHSSQNSIQYIRMLAKLLHCPLYSRSQTNQQQQQQNSTQLGSISVINHHQQQQHQQPPLIGGFNDEAKNNALLFECLRHKPVEQIVQRIPLELLQQNQPTGDISIATRFLKNSALQMESSDSSSSSSSSSQSFSQQMFQFPADQQQQQQQEQSQQQRQFFNSPIDISLLKKLVMFITREQLNKELRSVSEVKLDKDNNLVSPQLSELFTAIYGPSSANLRPLFGPIIDGTIIPDDDISINMLRTGSSFGQRDLMIGISRPVFGLFSDNNYDVVELNNLNNNVDRIVSNRIRVDHLIGDKISEKLEQDGLTSEQAIEFVNIFVRSFYRHHNQEIANSIINHYLNNANNKPTSATATKIWRTAKLQQSINLNKQQRLEVDQEVDSNEMKLHQQQLALLEALLEMFQDSFTNVPILKTALIHATKQLDPLLNVFAGQQFEKWKQGRLEQGVLSSSRSNNISSGGFSARNSTKFSEVERRSLLESFGHFARQLFDHSDWPLKLHSSITTTDTQQQQQQQEPLSQQPKATYLYQLDVSLLIKELQVALERLKLDYKKEKFDTATLNSIKDNFDGVLVKLQTGDFERHLGLACAFETAYLDGEDILDNNDILSDLKQVICSRFGSLIARFVATGNVNVKVKSEEFESNDDGFDEMDEANETDDEDKNFANQISKYTRECSIDNSDYHHLVQASTSSISPESKLKLKLECRAKLNKLTIAYLFSNDDDTSTDDNKKQNSNNSNNSNNNIQRNSQHSTWTVFNLFTQQIASLLSPKTIWNMKGVTEGSNHLYKQNYLDQKSSLISKSSFWSNFIPALNCSKTQPILPASLLATSSSLQSSLNSSLLSINLAFSCQQGAKTSIDVMDSLISTMEQQIESDIERWNSMQLSASRLSQSTSQNHHNLRMANMSQSGIGDESNQIEQQSLSENRQQQADEQQQSIISEKRLQSGRITNSSLESELIQVNDNQGKRNNDIHVKYVGIVLAACALVVSITLASGVFVMIRQRINWTRNGRKSNQMQHEQQQQQQQQANCSEHEMKFEATMGQQETTLSLDETNGFQANFLAANSLPVVNSQHHETEEQESNKMIERAFEKANINVFDHHQNVTVDGGLKGVEEQQQVFSHDALVYFDGGHVENSHRATNLSLCRSHSSVEVKTNGGVEHENGCLSRKGAIHHQVEQTTSPSDQLSRSEQEPIMMPILTTPLVNSRCRSTSATVDRSSTTLDYFNGQNHIINEHYGGSSSETQNQSTSLASSSKKRVKISDPIGTARRNKQQTMLYNNNHDKLNEQQLQLTQNSLYCPVHHHNSISPSSNGQTLSLEPNIYVESDLDATGNIHVWNGSHIDLMDHQRIAPIRFNCDSQYVAQNVPISTSYFTTSQTFDCNNQMSNHHQNVNPILNHNYAASYNQSDMSRFSRSDH